MMLLQQNNAASRMGATQDKNPTEDTRNDSKRQMRHGWIIFEDTALGRKGHFQGVQEACLTPAHMKGMKNDADAKGKSAIVPQVIPASINSGVE